MALPTNYLDYQKRVTSKIQNAPKYTYKPSRGKSTLPTLNLPVAKTTGQKAGEATKSFFRGALDTVGGFGKTVTHQLANWTDGKATLGDIPLYDQMNMAKKSIGDEFNKGGFHSVNAFLSAVPLGLQGIGREGKGFSETLKNAGVTNKNALMWGGLAGDIVLDPLNLLTGGGAAAAKAGLKATTGLNKVLAAEHGIQAGKNVYRTLDDLVSAGKVERGTKAFDDIEQRIASLANPARKQMDDSLLAINVPFTNMVKGIGTKPSWMLRNSEKIGSENANVVHNILREIGKDERWLKSKYGVDSIGDLDRQQLAHLQDIASKAGLYVKEGDMTPYATMTEKIIPQSSPSRKDILRNLNTLVGKGNRPKMGMSARKSQSFDKFVSKATMDLIKKGYKIPERPNLVDEAVNLENARGVDPFIDGRPRSYYEKRYNDFVDYVNANYKALDENEDTLAEIWTHFAKTDESFTLDELVDRAFKGYKEPVSKASTEIGDSLVGSISKDENIMKGLQDLFGKKSTPAPQTVDDILKQTNYDSIPLPKSPSPVKISQKYERFSDAKDIVPDYMKRAADRKFYRDAGGTSKLGNKIRKNIPILDKFNARVLQSDNVLASKSGDYIQDGYTKQAGMRHVIQKHYEKLNKMGKGLNDNELKTVAYILENKFPKGYDLAKWSSKHGIGREKMQQINAMVKYLKPALTHMAENEKKAGILDNTIENYFPHMLKKGKEEEYQAFIEKYKNDPDIQGIFGKSSKLGNNQERKGFKTLAELDEKLYSMQKALSKESDPSKIEELTDKINGLSNLFERNPVDAFAQRYYAGVKASAMKGIQDNLKKDGLMFTLGADKTAHIRQTEGLTKISPEDAKSFGLDVEKVHYMHSDVLKAFKEAEQLFTDEGMNKLTHNLVSATNVWRQFVTTYVPVHYVNNFIGNVANNTLAGIKPQSYVTAGNLMRKVSSGSLTKAEQRIMDEAAERGVMNGFQADFLPRPDSDNIIDKIGNRVSNWAYPRFNSKVGEQIDDVTRLAHFVEVYNKTGSFEKAGESVRKYLFNYNEITKADRLTKIVFPFWNWMKRNIPLQLKGLMSNPKYAANYNKIIQDLQGEEGENLPDWLKDTGLRIGANSFVDPRLPLQDLQNLGNLTPMDAMKYFGGSLNPLAKVPLEYWANKQFFNNRPIDYNYNQNGEYDPKELGAYLMNQTGIFGKLSKPMFDENVTVADSLRSLFLPKAYSPQ